MYAKILILLVLAILCTGCTDPDLPDPHEFDNITPGAPALKKSWDSETQTITISTLDDTPRLTIRKVSAVPDLCTFEEVLKIKSFVDYDLNKLKDFRARWNKHKGQHGITKVEWFILKNESYNTIVDDYETVQIEETHYDNVTEEYYNVSVNQTVLTGNHSEIRYHGVWKPFSPVGKSIHAGQTYTVKIVYHKPPELGDVRIQTIPMFAGVECEELTWWNSSWNYRRNLTINHSQVDAVMTNFPVMVSITQLGLNTDGNDTRITDSSDNQVAREIECYNSTSGKFVFFFNGTSVSDTSDTSFWMYYNNSAATEPAADSTYGSQAVWNGYSAVYHMTGIGSLVDSTSNGNNGTVGGNPTLADDTYGKKIVFDGNDYFDVADAATLDFSTTDFDILMVVKSGGGAAHSPLLSKLNPETATQWALQYLHTSGYFTFREDAVNRITGSVNMHDSTEHIIQFHRESGTFYWDVDSINKNSATVTRNLNNAALLSIGRRSSSYGDFRGDMAEIRIIKDTLSSNFRTTTYNNLKNPTATGTDPFFASFGAEESGTIISAYTPSTPLQKTTGDSQLFTVNTSENSQCRWYIDGSLIQTNTTGATRHGYLNSSLDGGYWNFTATANTTDVTSSQTWWVTAMSADEFAQDVYDGRWMYATNLNSTNLNLSQFFASLNPYYLSFYNATDQKTYNYKFGRWGKYASKEIKPGEAAMLRYTSNTTKTRNNASGTFGLTLQTGLNHIGHSYNGTRTLSWYNTTIASTNLVTIEHQNPENGTISTFTYGGADNGTVEVLQGCGVEVNVSSDTVISGL